MPNERSDVGRCGEVHDAEQNEEHPTSLKQPNTSRGRHDQTRMTKPITPGLTIDVRNAVGLNHCYLEILSPPNGN